MNVKLALRFVVVCAAGALLAGSACSQVKVSNAIEGGVGGVSAARCGNTIVVGFADTESTRPNSYDGVATSTNGGLTFTDRGTLPVPPVDPFGGPFTLGSNSNDPNGASNPSVACANSEVFYYASIYTLPGDQCSNDFGQCTAISISTSTNGGATWGLPVAASELQGTDVFDFVSPSMAVDPTNAMRLYVAYIEHDSGFGPPACALGLADSLAIVHSLDGGKTWSAPLFVDLSCDQQSDNPELMGSLMSPNISVSPGGKVYVAYEFVATSVNGAPPLPNEIRFTRSVDGGATFSAPIKVSRDAINNAIPKLGVDRTSSKHRGAIYLTWSGAPSGTYTDLLISESLDSGVSFSFPRPISPAPRTGTGRFQTNPALAVDNDGQIEACFYSTPSDKPTSSSVYSYNCATSFTHAATWAVHRLESSAPVGYDAVAGDFLLHNDGFFTAFELQANGQRHMVGEKSDNP